MREVLSPPLAAALASARLSASLSMREVGRRLSTSHATISRLEHGQRRPSVALARQLADVLDLDDDALTALIAASATAAGRSRPRRTHHTPSCPTPLRRSTCQTTSSPSPAT